MFVQAQPVRSVTDRNEWDQLAAFGPLYHSWSWSNQAVQRLQRQTSRPVTASYLRIWLGGNPADDEPFSLVGVPIIRFEDRRFNAPRTRPVVLMGCQVNAAAAVRRARPDIELWDDREHVAAIDRTYQSIMAHQTSHRTSHGLTPADLDEIRQRMVFPGDDARRAWCTAIEVAARCSAWNIRIRRHDNRGKFIGWTMTASTDTSTVVLAAAEVHRTVPPFACYR